MAAANLSSKKEIVFWARGQARSYSVMLFAQSRGYTPAVQPFSVSTSWRQFRFPIAAFDGLDGRDLEGLFIGASGAPGAFNLQIDDLEIR